jgi:HPt (histidine-containing phosphotransfer) domain-containing protein
MDQSTNPGGAAAYSADEAWSLVDMDMVTSLREVSNYPESDEFLRELLAIFAEHASKAIAGVAASLAADDLDELRRGAHQLKGSAANVGARRLSRRAAALDDAIGRSCASPDRAVLATFVAELPRLLDDSLGALRDVFFVPQSRSETPLHPGIN